MLRTAKAAGAHTLIGENVPNLLTINDGNDFHVVLDTLSEAGYAQRSPFISSRRRESPRGEWHRVGTNMGTVPKNVMTARSWQSVQVSE